MKLNDALRYTVVGGAFLLPLLPFLVTDSMFFPFITGKNFAFRIIAEIMFGAWALLAFRDVRYRPAFSWILIALFAFLSVIGIADLFGENVFKSFWSNFERMEGWFTLLHLFMYFLAVSSVFVTTRIWGWLAHISVGASVLVSFYGIGQLIGKFAIHQSDVRLDATIGNSAYLAIYLVFHIFITLVLMLRYRGSAFVRYLYLIPITLQVLILYHTATRGAILGFLGGMFLAALVVAVFEREHRIARRVAVGGLIAVVALVGLFFVAKDTNFVSESPVLSRFSTISVTEPTVLSRFTIWNMALEGFREHPVLGWGQENFNLVFNKHFHPELYDHEPWFDRVHNIFLDWLIAGGALGLLAYLFIPIATLYYLWYPRNRVHFSATERGLWTGLLAAYFFHNIFVFDNILSYVLYFSILAYVHARVGKPVSEERWLGKPLNAGTSRLLSPLIITMFFIGLYFFNWQGLMTARALLNSLSQNNPEARVTAFEKAASYDALGRQEVAEQLTQGSIQFSRLEVSIETRQRMFSLAEKEIREEIERSPNDARLRLFVATLYDQYGLSDRAKAEYEEALKLSPTKQNILHQVAFNRLRLGQPLEALEFFRKAYELEQSSDESRIYYAVGNLYTGNVGLADELLAGVTSEDAIVNNNLLVNAYVELGMHDRAVSILEKRIERTPHDPQLRLSLAVLYLELERREESIAEIERAIELNPDLETQGRSFIEEIRAGRNPVQGAN
ncbi:MAG TPA: O-antigen ligase family protein [Candidatus Paceibacterota bacterium]